MLYFVSLRHAPNQCPGVAIDIRGRVLTMASTMDEILERRGCSFHGGWVSKSAHLTVVVIDAPDAHTVDDLMIDLGLAVWNTADIYPVITLEEAVEGLAAQAAQEQGG